MRMVRGSALSPGLAESGVQRSQEQLLGPSSSPTRSLGCAFARAPAFQVAEHLVVIERKIMCSNNSEVLNLLVILTSYRQPALAGYGHTHAGYIFKSLN